MVKVAFKSDLRPKSLLEESAKILHNDENMKYILQWTLPKNLPSVDMDQGQKGFIERRCPFTNCFFTSDRLYLEDYTKFDVIAFSGPQVKRYEPNNLPRRRSLHQKYAFASVESSDIYTVCSNKFDGFFNWTWTYRLDSEVKWGYIVVRDSKDNIIGPRMDMNWISRENMTPTSKFVKNMLRKKRKAAAWIVSNCSSKSRRELFVLALQRELKKYDLQVDIYGPCGSLMCSNIVDNEFISNCGRLIEKDYYFYLSFEYSFAEDYVTEKLLYPLQNLAVPIVFGSANYTRFMPDNIYLNARELGAGKLAKKMNELIKNPEEYAEYFRWQNHYSYYGTAESSETDEYCKICSMLNEKKFMKETTVYENFYGWWNPLKQC